MRGRDLVEGSDYGVMGSHYGRFRMLRLEVPGWGGPRQVLMQAVGEATGEPSDAAPVFIRPQDVVAPWDAFRSEREARRQQEAADRDLQEQVIGELNRRGIEWSYGEWREGSFRISLGAVDLAALLGVGHSGSALEKIFGEP